MRRRGSRQMEFSDARVAPEIINSLRRARIESGLTELRNSLSNGVLQ